MNRRAAVPLALAALALAVAASCGKKAAVVAVAPASPAVVSTQPPARTSSYLYDGSIWAVFDRALDPRTVDTTTVFLKQDTQRVPITVRWDPNGRRIVLAPRVTLGLQKAYTVVLSTRIHGADGTPLGAAYSWQFVTNSLRRVRYDFPSPDTLRSSVVCLLWSNPDANPGPVVYELYVGTDSAAVEQRTLPWVQRSNATWFIPRTPWPAAERVYWAISGQNTATGERLHSPMRHFDTTPSDAPTQSVVAVAGDWGGLRSGTRTQQCIASELPIGPLYSAGMHFPLASVLFGDRVKSVRFRMRRAVGTTPSTSAWVSPATGAWTNCLANFPGPPFADPTLMVGATAVNDSDLVFESPALAAWIEASRRLPVNNGIAIGSTGGEMTIRTQSLGAPRPDLVITYFVP